MSTDGRWCYIVLWVAASRRGRAVDWDALKGGEKFRLIRANDDVTVLDALSFSALKIGLLRSLTVEKKNYVQVEGAKVLETCVYLLSVLSVECYTVIGVILYGYIVIGGM
ncbi:hypothetical protein TRIUR3_09528 [Triticum urartu]|uniref:ACT domain-containing protein n=1 Tax=Triticum urartu TaxID=4572 RepID=M7YBU2_TRIUA|nr:hypothetical protein TRIUR3_09528 [Triticum urartu]